MRKLRNSQSGKKDLPSHLMLGMITDSHARFGLDVQALQYMCPRLVLELFSESSSLVDPS